MTILTKNTDKLREEVAAIADTFRALCAELLDELEYQTDWSIAESLKAKARAALGEADEPAVPEGREPAAVTEQPSDEELALIYHDCCRGCEFMDPGGFEDAARAVLVRWGNPTPQPPADGEVAELVAKLRRLAPQNPLGTADPTITRAADLLERQALVPVPVSERPPGPEDMTDDGEVWIEDPGHEYPLADAGDYDWDPHKWILRPIGKFDAQNGLRWLPAHALPLPEVGE